MADPIRNVLFLCTGNTARSIMAEGILRQDGAGRFNSYSAGSMPKGVVNPLALQTLAAFGYPADGYASKHWGVFAGPSAPVMDFVVTVCDNAAGEACPLWPGQPISAHWGIEDPAAAAGTDTEKRAAFAAAFDYLRDRIRQFVRLPHGQMDHRTIQARLNELGTRAGSAGGRAIPSAEQ